MVDVIWGNGSDVLTTDSFLLNVTHRKDGNQFHYKDQEKIRIVSADIPGLPLIMDDWNEDLIKKAIIDAFLKCEVDSRDATGVLLAKVSHSGVGGY